MRQEAALVRIFGACCEGQIPSSWLRDAAFHVSQEIPSYETKMLRRIALRRTEKMSPQAEGMFQNTSGGTLSGDFSPKKSIFPEKNTPKIHRSHYFATPLFYLEVERSNTEKGSNRKRVWEKGFRK